MQRRFLLYLPCLIAILCAPEAYSQRGGFPPGFLPGSPLYAPITRGVARRYVGDGRWKRLTPYPNYNGDFDQYDNNRGRFDLRSPDAPIFRPIRSPFRYPNHKPTAEDRVRAICEMRARLWR